MSRYHDVVTWQSKDGTWSHAFYAILGDYHSGWDDDGTDEWDNEYNHDEFQSVVTGYPTADAAREAHDRKYSNANVGYSSDQEYEEGFSEKLDEVAFAFSHPEEAAKIREERESKARDEQLLNSIIPPVGSKVTIWETQTGGRTGYHGTLYKGEDGSLNVKAMRGNKEVNVKLFTATGRVPKGNKIGAIERIFPAPTFGAYGRGYGAAKPQSRQCGAPTPKGACTRQTYTSRCWQHS